MKKLILIISIAFTANLVKAQGGVGGAAAMQVLQYGSILEINYKKIFPASDSVKKIYSKGGGLEVGFGIPLKKGFRIMLTGGIDKVKLKTNGNDGTIWATGGFRKDMLLFTSKAKHASKKDVTNLFIVANYGKAVSDYNARVSAESGYKTTVWDAGIGIALFDFIQISYNYNNFKDIKHNTWQAMHQIKFGLQFDLKKSANNGY
jgi:hypothetical protein